MGPTASGKTELACRLAYDLKGEIISADSRQVYKDMDIGTGKDIEEYQVMGKAIPYHLIDIREAGYKYNIFEFQTDFLKAFNIINQKNHQAILCGGSGLYLETALSGNSFLGIPKNDILRAELAELTDSELQNRWDNLPAKLKEKLDCNTNKRMIRSIEIANYIHEHPDWKPVQYPNFDSVIFGIDIDRDLRRTKITKRLSYRLNNGLYEEVQKLLDKGLSFEDLAYYGLEYKWLGNYFQGKITKKELFEGLNIAIHQFSKRQMTWFRRMEKQGYHINWINADWPMKEKLEFVKSKI